MKTTLPFDPSGISVVIFDHGNTLIELGKRQILSQNALLRDALSEIFGDCDVAKLREVRDRQIMRPFHNGFRENNLREICTELVRELYDVEPDEEVVSRLERVRCEAYLAGIRRSAGLHRVLKVLRSRFRLGLLSNYPVAQPIVESLDVLGVRDLFSGIVVSADVGYVKPHPLPFREILARLDVPASEAVYVGDNWLADVQGAKRAGMKAVHTTQFIPYERFEPQDGDYLPDGRIAHLNDLPGLLGISEAE